jgi:uncharacterized protein (DUF58 family)
MTSRGRAVLVLGVLCWVVAFVFGSRALYPVAAGLVLAVPLAVAWVRLSVRRPRLGRRLLEHELVEGDELRVELSLEPASRLPLPAAVAEEPVGRLGRRQVSFTRSRSGRYAGSYVLSGVPRGRHGLGPASLVVGDPFGLAESRLATAGRRAVVVRPRLVELERLFFDGGAGAGDGRRLLLRRSAGFELHSVREHQQGESLRRVHWPTTARRGALMVKELEDAPRDEVTVLLDGDAAAAVGAPPESSFDTAVRVAGSILLSQVHRGRRCLLVLNTRGREKQAVSSERRELLRALQLLAVVEADARTPVSSLLESGVGPAAGALELVVVTARIESGLVSRLLERAMSRRSVALVHVEAASFDGHPRRAEPGLLRLQAAGVPVAVVRRGDDLASALSATQAREGAGA